MAPSYDHAQKSPLAAICIVLAVTCVVLAGLGAASAGGAGRRELALALPALPLALLGLSFGSLRVRSEGEHLRVRFGPVGFLGTSLRYAEVRAVRVARSTLLDGWGLHWRPSRGWIYNLWGFDCVEVETATRKLRIGTDDARGLARHLQERAGLDGRTG